MNKNIFTNANGQIIEFTQHEAIYAISNLPFFDKNLMADDDIENAIHVIKIITNLNGFSLGYPAANITNPIYLAIGAAAINSRDNVQRPFKATIDIWEESVNLAEYPMPEDYEIAKALREYFDIKGKILYVSENFDEVGVKKYIIEKYDLDMTIENTVAEILDVMYEERKINTVYALIDDVIGVQECNDLIMLYFEKNKYNEGVEENADCVV